MFNKCAQEGESIFVGIIRYGVEKNATNIGLNDIRAIESGAIGFDSKQTEKRRKLNPVGRVVLVLYLIDNKTDE